MFKCHISLNQRNLLLFALYFHPYDWQKIQLQSCLVCSLLSSRDLFKDILVFAMPLLAESYQLLHLLWLSSFPGHWSGSCTRKTGDAPHGGALFYHTQNLRLLWTWRQVWAANGHRVSIPLPWEGAQVLEPFYNLPGVSAHAPDSVAGPQGNQPSSSIRQLVWLLLQSPNLHILLRKAQSREIFVLSVMGGKRIGK